MRMILRRALSALLPVVAVVGITASPAAAHGSCGATSGPPTVDTNTWNADGDHPWTWIATASCTVAHPDTYMRTCLQSSPTAGLLVGWDTIECRERTWSADRQNFTFPVTVWSDCMAGMWYRTWTVFSTGNGGWHWGIIAESPPVLACT